MKYVFILLLLTIVSCEEKKPKHEFACGLAKTVTSMVSQGFTTKWSCDYDKVFEFLSKPLEANICKPEKRSSLVSSFCPVIVESLMNMSATKIATELSCDPIKVVEDMKDIKNICASLKF